MSCNSVIGNYIYGGSSETAEKMANGNANDENGISLELTLG